MTTVSPTKLTEDAAFHLLAPALGELAEMFGHVQSISERARILKRLSIAAQSDALRAIHDFVKITKGQTNDLLLLLQQHFTGADAHGASYREIGEARIRTFETLSALEGALFELTTL